MPELPEVETIKESMRQTMEKAQIESVAVYNRHLRQEIPHNFAKIITSAKISHIYRIAKYALWQLDNGYTIIWHFGMSGKIKILDALPGNLEKHDHVVIQTSKGIVIYNDPRRFGLLTLCKSDKLLCHPLFEHLGIDPFDSRLDADYLHEFLKFKKIPIKIALLDQSIITGIGNIYASESLYHARISPLRESSSLNKKELKNLIESLRDVLRKAIDAGGSTLHDYKKPDGSTGYFQFLHAVYGKDGQSCPLCQNKQSCQRIQKIIQGGRSTYYCPHIQK